MSEFVITVQGSYPRPLPDDLRGALMESIEIHCKAYGCAVHVEFGHVNRAEPS